MAGKPFVDKGQSAVPGLLRERDKGRIQSVSPSEPFRVTWQAGVQGGRAKQWEARSGKVLGSSSW